MPRDQKPHADEVAYHAHQADAIKGAIALMEALKPLVAAVDAAPDSAPDVKALLHAVEGTLADPALDYGRSRQWLRTREWRSRSVSPSHRGVLDGIVTAIGGRLDRVGHSRALTELRDETRSRLRKLSKSPILARGESAKTKTLRELIERAVQAGFAAHMDRDKK